MNIRIGQGYDSHRFASDRKLIIGGVDIPYEKGLIGHSDADVLIHAVIDAVLGAMGKSDIGTLFPDNDAAYKCADSMKLLEAVVAIMHENGYTLGNIDSTVVAEAPKMKPHVPKMKENLARAFSCDVGQVGVKAKTNEKMDDIGNGLGIVSYAAVLLIKS